MRANKPVLNLSAALLLSAGLVACDTDSPVADPNRNEVEPVELPSDSPYDEPTQPDSSGVLPEEGEPLPVRP